MKRCTAVYPNAKIEYLWWSGAVRECDTSIVSAPLLTWGQHKHRAQAATLQVSQQWLGASPSTRHPAQAASTVKGVKGLGVMEARAELVTVMIIEVILPVAQVRVRRLLPIPTHHITPVITLHHCRGATPPQSPHPHTDAGCEPSNDPNTVQSPSPPLQIV